MKPPIEFIVYGEPKAQARPRAFARKVGGKFFARVYDAGTAEHWKSEIATCARPFIPEKLLTGPVRVDLEFFFARPKSHYRAGKHSNELRKDAPCWHTTKPDKENAEKAVLDALTRLGFWKDDAQVCDGRVTKRYAAGIPSCKISIKELVDEL